MPKFEKGQKLVCVPCGREVVVDSCGLSTTELWCCGQVMKPKTKAVSKKTMSKKT